MSHQCVKCGRIFSSTAPEVLKGCVCGSHYFFFFKEEDKVLAQQAENLTRDEREEIVEDIKEMVGPEIEKPIILELESIRIPKPGKFEIDLVSLFRRKPVIYRIEEGKYIIDLPSTFHMLKDRGSLRPALKPRIAKPSKAEADVVNIEEEIREKIEQEEPEELEENGEEEELGEEVEEEKNEEE